MKSHLYNSIFKSSGKPTVAVLIDPEKQELSSLERTLDTCHNCNVGFIMVGGSLVSENPGRFIKAVKNLTHLPVILFPGSLMQISHEADAMLLLSLISGRNPEFLIGNHVLASQYIKNSNIETIPTGYILVESGMPTTVQYISNTLPIPANKPELAVATSIAGELLGLRAIYLEAGSGALNPVPETLIKAVKKNISIPLIVGGGIRNAAQFIAISNAGADIIVIGNSLENKPDALYKILGK